MNIGQRIAERRKQLNMTQEELAHKMGYKSKSSINKIELGINDVPQKKIVQFAKELDTTVNYLMDWDEGIVSQPDPEYVAEQEKYELLNMLFHELQPEAQRMIIAQLQALVQLQENVGDIEEFL